MKKVYITDKQGNEVLPKTHVSAVYDDEGNDLGSHLGAFEDEVRGLVDTPHQEYVTVATYASLPASGSEDTIYRVSNYDGSQSQVAADVYSEYAWDGTQYVFLCVKSAVGEVFDISAYHNNATYADLNAALTSNTGGVPQSLQKGGMSIKYVQSSDNKYVQFRLFADEFTVDTSVWAFYGNNVLIDSPEWVMAVTDEKKRVLYGVKVDGKFYFGAGCPPQVKKYVSEVLAIKVDKVDGKSLINKEIADSIDIIDNPIWVNVLSDSKGKFIEGINKTTGRKHYGIMPEPVNTELKNIINDYKSILVSKGTYNSGIVVFDLNKVQEGDVIFYDIDAVAGQNAVITLYDKYNRRIRSYGKTFMALTPTNYHGSFRIDNEFNYAVIGSSAGTIHVNYIAKNFHNGENNKLKAGEISGELTFGERINIFSNRDSDATVYDSSSLGFYNILKISDEMYYMYYFGQGEQYHFNFLFAYSTDLEHWTRGFPSGVEAPIPGTNLLLPLGSGLSGHHVIKVPDSEYPFRLIAQQSRPVAEEGNPQDCVMYKSADGIHFVNKKVIWKGYADTQVSVICRGNILKIYGRMDGWLDDNPNPSANRKHFVRSIGIMYCDLDGNALVPPTNVFGWSLYNPAASPFDDRREILFPTFFQTNTQEAKLHCYIADGSRIKPVEVDFSALTTTEDKWVAVSPNIIQKGQTLYLSFYTGNQEHDAAWAEGAINNYYIIPVIFKTEGLTFGEFMGLE